MNLLEQYIKKHIKRNGPITFAEFMQFALYHEDLGYYTKGELKIGKEGDFYTSPHVSSTFGSIIAKLIKKAFDFLETDEFTVLELGAGKGYLAMDILNYLSDDPEHFKNINYIIIDKSNRLNQVKLKQIHEKKLKIYNDISLLPNNINGIVISNEFFDSLPFHRIIYMNNEYNEIYIDLENDGLREIIKVLSSEDIKNYLNNYNLDPVESKQIEVNLSAEKVFTDINNVLECGYILTIDYGFLSDEYFNNEKTKGSFRCFYKHSVNDRPLLNIGNQDITADVDFTSLINCGNSLGIEEIKYTTQGQFLVDWGILDILEKESLKHDQSAINSIKNLFMPGMMGNYFKVLLQSKDIRDGVDIYPDSDLTISFGVN